MGGGPVPGGSGRRVDPGGRGYTHTIRDVSHREPGEPCSGKQGWDRGDAPAVCRDVTFGAVRIAQRLVRRGKSGVAVVAVAGIRGGHGRGARKIQTGVMAGQRELGPEQRRHREEGGALEPLPTAEAGHGLSLLVSAADATDPCQVRARSPVFSGNADDFDRPRALPTTDTELRLMASAATIGLSRIPNAG